MLKVMPEALKEKKTNHLSENIDFLLRKENLDIKNLAILTGVPAPSISRLKREGANPTISTLEPISSYFEVDIQSLMYSNLSNSSFILPREATADIPIYSMDDFSMKSPVVNDHISVSGVNTSHNLFGLKVRSDSLKPVFNKGAIVIVDPQLSPQEGDYALCTVGENEPPVFRQVFLDGKRVFFRSVNPMFNGGMVEQEYSIIGVIIRSIEQFR